MTTEAADNEREMNDRAMLVALELIRRAIADLPGAIAVNIATGGAASSGAQAAGPTPEMVGAHGYETGRAGAAVRAKEAGTIRAPAATDAAGSDWMKRQADAIGKAFANVGNVLAIRLSAMLGPLAVMTQVIQSNNSGFGVLGSAVRLLANTIAPIVLPAVLALAGAVVDLSDELKGKALAAMKTVYGFAMNTLVPALRFVVNNFELLAVGAVALLATFNPLAAGIIGLIALLSGEIKPGSETDKMAGALVDALSLQFHGDETKGLKERQAESFGALSDRSVAGATGGFGEDSVEAAKKRAEARIPRSGMDDVIRSLQLSLGPKATATGLGQVGTQAQLAALNADPIEMRSLRVQQDMLKELMELRRESRREGFEPVYGREG